MEYILFKYREKMKYTPDVVRTMWGTDLLCDLEMMGLESKHGPAAAKQPQPPKQSNPAMAHRPNMP